MNYFVKSVLYVENRKVLPRKNFLPNLSMWKIVHKFPGKAEIEMRNELRNTSLVGITLP